MRTGRSCGAAAQWFERMAEAQAALWWIPRGHTPTTDEAEERVIHLREFGPTPYAFTLKEHFPPPDSGGLGGLRPDPQPAGVDLPGLSAAGWRSATV